MKHARQHLVSDLHRLGLRAGEIVMVHASVRAVGPVFGGPDEIHLAIVDAVSPGGAMLMVLGAPAGADDVGRGFYTPDEEAEILQHQPAFDPQTARAARDIGTLAEFFRSWPGTLVSDAAPGRMAARGEAAAELVADAPWNYCYGRGSPLDRLVAARGKVLLLGSDHDEVTLLHYAEHVGAFPGKRIARFKVPVLQDGQRVWVDCEEVDSGAEGAHENWPDRFFAIIVDKFIAAFEGTEACVRGQVGDADSYLLDAAGLVDFAMPIMIATATEG